MNETDKLIEEQLKILPQNLVQAINAVPWKTVVRDIGKENGLDAEQMTSLEQETMFIIYGFENPDDYVSNVTKNVGVSEDVTSIMAKSVVEKVFDPILKRSKEYENSTESIRKILKANTGEDKDKLIENQLKKLPEALELAVKTVPWQSVVKEIALLYKLDLAQIVAVERETMLVIYGFEDEKNYLSNIMREANLDEAMVTTITTTLNERVFKVIANKARESGSAPKNIIVNVPEIPPTSLPMIERGEVVHDARPLTPERSDGGRVPHVEQPSETQLEQTKVPVPDYRYPNGKDPYREPLV